MGLQAQRINKHRWLILGIREQIDPACRAQRILAYELL
jgi:hypothetical protein